MSFYGNQNALGYQQLPVDTVTALTIPDRTAMIIVIPEGQACRWRDDGTAPTAAVGMPLDVSQPLFYDSKAADSLRFIAQAAGCIINVAYYGKGA